MKKHKAWLILPLLAIVKYEDGETKLTIGWLDITVDFKINKN
jgi:hypothetical protein